MGVFLNSTNAYTLYKGETMKPYFVDKSRILEELFPLVRYGNSHICITRPRRFGKTIMANMIAAFFCKVHDAQNIFGSLQISASEEYQTYRNKYSVVHISFNELPKACVSYGQYIDRIERRLIMDLQREYPHVELDEDGAVWDAFLAVYMADSTARFIFVLDEWDYIFHQDFITENDKKMHLIFLRGLLKDRPYVLLDYMTGILPIAKYSSGSELNMFIEYTMVSEPRFSEYFGFTETEVDAVFERYQKSSIEQAFVTREGLRSWYDGYHTKSGARLYNPRSVVASLENNNLGNYWTSSGPYDELYYYIENNVELVRDDLALMVSGISVPAKIWEYAATSQNLKSREEIFSAMVVYGFLSYENGRVVIPNKELMDKFSIMLQKETSLGYVYRLAKESEHMFKATLAADTETMERILEFTHDTEVPILSYNHETELTAVVNLVYLASRDTYRVEREDKAGRGYVDFIFYPEMDKGADCIILELKVDHTPEEAIEQIKAKKYALRFQGRIGETPKYTGRILGVGIGYDKAKKKHRCIVEAL